MENYEDDSKNWPRASIRKPGFEYSMEGIVVNTEQSGRASEVDMEFADKVRALLDFSITNGYDVDDQIIEDIRSAMSKITSDFDGQSQDDVVQARVKLDNAPRDLTKITYPVTINTLNTDNENTEYEKFKKWLFGLGIGSLLVAVTCFLLSANVKTINTTVLASFFAIALGLLGAVVYSLFVVLRVVPTEAFRSNDAYSNYARLLLGALLAWLFYFVFGREALENSISGSLTTGPDNQNDAFYILLPFIAGYSTKFVIALLERVITALEITLGIEEKRDVKTQQAIKSRENP